MKRREFIQLSLAAFAAANYPYWQTTAASAAQLGTAASFTLLPRRLELLDADWLFFAEPAESLTTVITDWVWTAGTIDQVSQMTAPGLDTSGGTWKQTSPGISTLAENSGGWYSTTLPNIPGPGRTIHFESVDDNGTVYLNGHQTATHNGFSPGFDVPLDSAWNNAGSNILTVFVQNIGGPGGLMKAVTAGQVLTYDYSASNISDLGWRTVHLPHDYVVEGEYDSTLDVGHGALPVTAAWYRKHFNMPLSDQGKSVWLYFEGVFRNATVYVNGKQVYFQDDGYDPFYVDIVGSLNFGADNVIAVHVDPRGGEGWWYEGGGIYRHVWLNVADPLHVVPWGVYVTSTVVDVESVPAAALTIQTHIVNEGMADRTVNVHTDIIDPTGQRTASVASSHTIQAGSDMQIMQSANVPAAALWSLETPNLYYSETTISSHGKSIDKFQQRFGIRTLRFDPNSGFYLNEKSVKLQGTCNHQDFVGVGIGMPDSILYWRMQQLKDKLGCNAIRCSHNPMAPSMYDACDELGLLVMDETRHPGDAPETKASTTSPFSHTDHIEKMIRRDRSHPSVIMWSMANEEWSVQGDPYGAEMLTALMAAIHKHDMTRPVTTATNMGNGNGWLVGFGSVEDLLGVNYNYGSYDWIRAKYPQKPLFGSETGSDLFCRGIYNTDAQGGHITSYKSPENSWKPCGQHDYVMGGFVWTGFDYRGEPSPYPWPEISSNFGLLDTCGFPKDSAYYYRAWWKQDEAQIHIFPHWNWSGKEGQVIPIWCYSNCDSVELFLNGVSQGVQQMPEFGHIEWNQVAYEPGVLKAVGYKGGQNVVQDVVQTTGAPAAIRLIPSRSILTADGEDTVPVEVQIVDAQGLVVPVANNLVNFTVSGSGVNAGVGNGDPASHEPNQDEMRRAFNGLCMVLIKAATSGGTVSLQAASDGLTGAALSLAAS